MRIVFLSDTHGAHRRISVPDGDLLLHGGDHTARGGIAELTAAADWLRELPHRHKVVIGGNHDFCLVENRALARDLFHGLTYLENESLELDGLRLFGSPYTPKFGQWAFQAPRGEAMARIWETIPPDTQLLLTHGPPLGQGDDTARNVAAGCADLRDRVARVKPLLHLFGHIHEGYGASVGRDPTLAETLFLNGSSCSLGHLYHQPPHVIDWDGRGFRCVTDHRAGEPLWSYLVAKYGAPKRVDKGTNGLGALQVEELEHDAQGSGVWFSAPAGAEERGKTSGVSVTFGVPLPELWLVLLNRNSWARLSEVPQFPSTPREPCSDT